MTTQRTLLFALPQNRPHPEIDATDWRARWMQAGVGTTPDWNSVRVVPKQDMLWIISGKSEANAWLDTQLDGIAAVVADTCQDVAKLEVKDRFINVRADSDRLWAYRFPAIAVDKGSGDWGPHFQPSLDPALVQKIALKCEAALRRELSVWGHLPFALAAGGRFMSITQPGRPVIVPAIHADRSGHGKQVHALIRKHLVAVSPIRFEGEFFAGTLNALGYGRMLRTSAPETLSREVQQELLEFPDYAEAIA